MQLEAREGAGGGGLHFGGMHKCRTGWREREKRVLRQKERLAEIKEMTERAEEGQTGRRFMSRDRAATVELCVCVS